jgi:hypothetical protein
VSALITPEVRQELLNQNWSPSLSFADRLVKFRRLLQKHLDPIPDAHAFEPRVAISPRLTLDDLALLLPPTEQRLLAHLRARKPFSEIDGTTGFRTARWRTIVLQRLVSRVQAYCGAGVRYRLMQPYDRPGHAHRRRVGAPRKVLPMPTLRVYVPPWFAARHRDDLVMLEGKRTLEDHKRILRRRVARLKRTFERLGIREGVGGGERAVVG